MPSSKGVIFSQHATSAENMADAQALDAQVLQAYFDENGPDPSALHYMDPIVHPNSNDPRVFYETCDSFSEGVCTSLGFTIVEVDRPGEWFIPPNMP